MASDVLGRLNALFHSSKMTLSIATINSDTRYPRPFRKRGGIFRSTWVILLITQLIFPIPSAQSSQDKELQPLQRESTLAGKLGAVGVIVNEYGPRISIATGFMVSPCHVLTAAHALAKNGGKVVIGMGVRFIPEGNRYDYISEHSIRGKVVATGMEVVANQQFNDVDTERIFRDWGLIELEYPLSGISPIKVLFPGAKLDTDILLSVAGYPAGSPNHILYAQEHCSNLQRHHAGIDSDRALLADCAVRPGMSGGPVLLENPSEPIAVGIVVERLEIGQKVLTIAAPIRSFANRISQVMRSSQVCAIGSPFGIPQDRP